MLPLPYHAIMSNLKCFHKLNRCKWCYTTSPLNTLSPFKGFSSLPKCFPRHYKETCKSTENEWKRGIFGSYWLCALRVYVYDFHRHKPALERSFSSFLFLCLFVDVDEKIHKSVFRKAKRNSKGNFLFFDSTPLCGLNKRRQFQGCITLGLNWPKFDESSLNEYLMGNPFDVFFWAWHQRERHGDKRKSM